MCLTTVIKTFKGTDSVVSEGWKIFKKAGDKLEFCHASEYVTKKNLPKLVIGKWLTSTNGKINLYDYDKTKYETGFHICLTREGARKYKKDWYSKEFFVIRKVRFKGITTIGTDSYIDTVVAKKMMLLNVRG